MVPESPVVDGEDDIPQKDSEHLARGLFSTIIDNVALSLLRRKKREAQLREACASQIADNGLSDIQLMEFKDKLGEFDDLSQRIILSRMEGHTLKEIANDLDTTIPRVRGVLSQLDQ